MKKFILLFALVLTVCSTARAETLTAESEVGTVGILAGREAMVVDLGGSIGKVAIALENVGATAEDAFGTRFSTTSGATNFYAPETYKLEDGWYVPSQDELSALKSLLAWKSDNSAVYYKNHSDLQFPLRPSGQSYYGDYITSTTSVSGTYTDYAYLYIAYAYNKGEGYGTRSISMSEGHNQSDFAIRPFHKLPTKNQCLFYTSSDNSVVTPSFEYFNVSIESNTYENGQGVITFSGELTNIGDYAFSGKSTLTSVTFPASLIRIGGWSFLSCTSLTSLAFADNSKLETIDSYAFRGTAISKLDLPASVTSIKDAAFYECASLTYLTFADNSKLEMIAEDAFIGTAISGQLDLPASLKSIGSAAFSGTQITAVTIPALVTTIGREAFAGCDKLVTLTFAEGLQMETIEKEAFEGTQITAVTIPAKVRTIENWAFYNCRQLSSLTFAEGSELETIGGSAFNSTAISGDFTFPASVTSIQGSAFENCQLSKIYMSLEDLSNIANNAFNSDAVIIVPINLYETYKTHFDGHNKVEVTPLKDWQEYAITQIEAAMKTVNTLSPTDKATIEGYIADIRDAESFDEICTIRDVALALINQQKAFEEKVKGVFNTLGTKQDGPAIEIVGKDGQTIQLYNIEKVNFIKVKVEE